MAPSKNLNTFDARNPTETIFAQATPQGVGAVAVFRLSGPQAPVVLETLAGFLPAPRRACVAHLRDPADGGVIDEALVLFFQSPHSFTGEDVVEFQTHGSAAVGRKLAQTCLKFKGVRLAEPGEFTKRAVLNGRMDLVEAEGLSDLLWARTELQRQQAWNQYDGQLSRQIVAWRQTLLDHLAFAEALMEFGEESDLDSSERRKKTNHALRCLQDQWRHAFESWPAAQNLRKGMEIMIVGAPNAGKSSLLNALAQSSVALVSERAGTTRDMVQAEMDLGGWPVVLVDTAGLRRTEDSVEAQGMSWALQRLASASIICLLVESAAESLEPALQSVFEPLGAETSLVLVWSKADQTTPAPPLQKAAADLLRGRSYETISLCVFDPRSLQDFRTLLEEAIRRRPSAAQEQAPLSRLRHLERLKKAYGYIAQALEESREDLFIENLRAAALELGRLGGFVSVEDVFERIFSNFCIGK